jgi:SAM-dependent methyltransferase
MDAASSVKANLLACYPERALDGFSRVDSTFLFYSYVNALVDSASTVLDLGAGRGVTGQTTSSRVIRNLLIFKGRVARIVGVDVDPAVLENPFLDEAVLIQSDGKLPFPDASFDVVISDWVLEHIEDPPQFTREVSRVLKPGGWFCARTPNKFGIISLGANSIPNAFHARILKRLQPSRQAVDVFPTRYRLNTLAAVRRFFPADQWRNCSFSYAPEILYFARSRFLFRLSILLARFTPQAFLPVLLIFVQKQRA